MTFPVAGSTLLGFLGVSVVFALLPGPNVVFLTTTALTRGARSAWRSALGVETATLVFAVLTASGLGAVIVASEVVFQALKWAGVLYLAWLGFQAWRSSARPDPSHPAGPTPAPAPRAAYARGFLLGIANPKVVLFFMAFLPQFVVSATPAWQQLLVLGLLFTLIGISCDAIFCFAAGALGQRLGRLRRSRSRAFTRKLPAVTYFGLAGWAAATGSRTA